jgi:predicted membrane protein
MISFFAKNTRAWVMNVVHEVVHAIIYGVKVAAYIIGGILLAILTIAALRYCLKSYLERRRKKLQQIAATEQRQRNAEYNRRMAQQRQEDAKR